REPGAAHEAVRWVRVRERRQNAAFAQQLRVRERRFNGLSGRELFERAPFAGSLHGELPGRLDARQRQHRAIVFDTRDPRASGIRELQQSHNHPASTMYSCAEHARASSEARNKAIGATSSGRTLSGSTWLRLISSSPAASSHLSICRCVMIQPGVMTLTRMRCSPSSAASPRVRPMTDDLAVVYTGKPRPFAPYELEPKLMMEPPPIFFMPGTTA